MSPATPASSGGGTADVDVSDHSVAGVVFMDAFRHQGIAVFQVDGTAYATASLRVEGFLPSLPYAFVAVCNNDELSMSPPVGTVPASLSLQYPTVTGVFTAGALNTAGGSTVLVSGVQIGVVGVVKVMVLTNGRFRLTSGPCSVSVVGAQLSCVAPVGVGGGYAVAVTVDNFTSAAFNGTLLSYSLPSVSSVTVMEDAVPVDASTAGGELVVIRGTSFGRVASSQLVLDDVAYGRVRCSGGGGMLVYSFPLFLPSVAAWYGCVSV